MFEGAMVMPEDVVEGWASEEDCFAFGAITRTGEECDLTCAMQKSSNGCGHFTQVVWRATGELGCGVATCAGGGRHREVWVCNYRQQGNIIGMKPY
jgi:pathogenesis-related protein 1